MNIGVEWGRAEALGSGPLAGRFRTVTMRAVAAGSAAEALAAPFLHPEGALAVSLGPPAAARRGTRREVALAVPGELPWRRRVSYNPFNGAGRGRFTWNTTGQPSRSIAVVNQKGGVGKTTTAVSLASALAVADRPTLLVDLDPQANATAGLSPEGSRPESPTIYDVLAEGRPATESLRATGIPGLSLLPGSPGSGRGRSRSRRRCRRREGAAPGGASPGPGTVPRMS